MVRASRKTLIVGASRETHVLHRRLEDRQRLGLQRAELLHLARRHPAIDLRAARAEPSGLPLPRPQNVLAQLGRGLAGGAYRPVG
jgi:hypothetical protein